MQNEHNMSTTFEYTGGDQTWIVPDGVTFIKAKVVGASGESSPDGLGGKGGTAATGGRDIPVTPGQMLQIVVGGRGGGQSAGIGGYNGGGNGGVWGIGGRGGGGGGASDIRRSETVLLSAGGGGGQGVALQSDSASNGNGGNGGGLNGEAGASNLSVGGGQGGTDTVGGLGGTGENPGTAGTSFVGGQGASRPQLALFAGGGGGGGYQGGGGGATDPDGGAGGGGGGSGYAHPDFAENVTFGVAADEGNGQVVIEYFREVTLTTTPAVPILTQTGWQLSETATVVFDGVGLVPTGTVTFTLYGPLNPDNLMCNSGTQVGSPVTLSLDQNGATPPATFDDVPAGLYQFVASYSGDETYAPFESACNDPSQQVTVSLLTPEIATLASQTVVRVDGRIVLTDTATVSGEVGGPTPTGQVEFNLHGPFPDVTSVSCDSSDTLVAKFLVSLVPDTVVSPPRATATGNTDLSTLSPRPSAPGVYQWVARYLPSDGPPNFYDSVSGVCKDPDEQVTVEDVPPQPPQPQPPQSSRARRLRGFASRLSCPVVVQSSRTGKRQCAPTV